METPLLSVCLITYNHENYIRQALDSVFMQKVNFPWEVIVADDCSPDNTRQIILEYKSKYPDLVRLLFQEKNVGAGKNFINLLEAANSTYIAYLEGDDYWTDIFKLQKQIDFLEKNKYFILHSHEAEVLKKNEIIGLYHQHSSPIEINRELLNSNFGFPSASVVFKNIFINKTLPEEITKWPQDTVLFIYLSYHGKIYLSNEIMSVYRIHPNGIWSGSNDLEIIHKILAMRNYTKKVFTFTKTELHEIYKLECKIRLQRIKSYANRLWFNKQYFKDILFVLKAKYKGEDIKFKYFIFCLYPDFKELKKNVNGKLLN